VHRDIIPHHGGGACDIWEVACVGANQDTDIVERAGMVDQDDDRSYMELCDRGSSCFDRWWMVMIDKFREMFLKRLTEDSESQDRRRKGFNQAIFDIDEGYAIFNGTDLSMVMTAFDDAVKDMKRSEIK
jgi:hypothetical protein